MIDFPSFFVVVCTFLWPKRAPSRQLNFPVDRSKVTTSSVLSRQRYPSAWYLRHSCIFRKRIRLLCNIFRRVRKLSCTIHKIAWKANLWHSVGWNLRLSEFFQIRQLLDLEKWFLISNTVPWDCWKVGELRKILRKFEKWCVFCEILEDKFKIFGDSVENFGKMNLRKKCY